MGRSLINLLVAGSALLSSCIYETRWQELTDEEYSAVQQTIEVWEEAGLPTNDCDYLRRDRIRILRTSQQYVHDSCGIGEDPPLQGCVSIMKSINYPRGLTWIRAIEHVDEGTHTSLMAHETLHILSFCGFGDFDGNHLRVGIWEDNENGVHALTMNNLGF